jgi:hypothetical protein
VVIVGVLGWAIAQFGSVRDARLYASGVRIVAEGTPIEIPEGRAGETREAAFLVRNLSGNPVQIIGASKSCGCIEVEKLPLTVPRKGVKEVRLTINLEQAAEGAINQAIVFHTDDAATPRFAVTVSGRVLGQ